MNDLGLTLAWLAVQVAILLAPALALHALATRRGPAPGAWVATLSLGLVVALNVAAFMPGIDRKDTASAIAPPTMPREGAAAPAIPPSLSNRVDGPGVIHPAGGRGRGLAWLRLAWDRLGRGAAEPAVRVWPWGNILAIVAMAGTAAGLLRLTIGIWAVTLCYRRGQPVDDPTMTGLLDELQSAMGCRRPVVLREVPDLTTPATAGRRRPVVMLPDDWRSWSYAERRAVLAHELAHIVRGDYATGLLARLAVVLNYYHPLVRWMAARLQLQQEQAADALGARFAGGPTRYLVALSSLALRQDGRSPSWPARAFLPARGTLIRRIAMLRDESKSKTLQRPWSRARRLITAFGLLGLTIGVATLRGPARGAEDGPPPAAKAEVAAPEPRDQTNPSIPIYIRERADGVVVVRPAAAFRRTGMARLLAVIKAAWGEELSMFATQLKIDTSRPGFLKLRCQDIEWVTGAVMFARHKNDAEDKPVHTFGIGTPTVRMIAPFDWLAFLRQWRFECEKVGVEGRAYYKIKGKFAAMLGPNPCAFLPDDRTIVFDEEDVIRKMAGGEQSTSPPFVCGQDWERASRGLIAVAIKNQDGTFTKHYDLGRPDDAVVLSLFKGVDSWIFGVDDADALVLHADATSRGRDASEAVSRQLDSLIKLGRQFLLEQLDPKSPEVVAHDQMARMLKSLAANVRVEHTDNAITVQTQNFGTLADFAAIVEGEARESKDRAAARKEAKNSVKR
jgi:beta-lactamase regulating signal transducer with metallopeptidase domain